MGQHNSRLLIPAKPRLHCQLVLAICIFKQVVMMSHWDCTCTGHMGCLALFGSVSVMLSSRCCASAWLAGVQLWW